MAVSSKTLWLPLLGVFLWGVIDMTNGQNVIEAGGKRFTILTQKRNWYQANLACVGSGMSLAAIESDAEYTALRNHIINNNLFGKEFWLSGSNLDNNDASEYTWLSNGKKLSYTQWQSSKPSGVASACLYTDIQFKWDSIACTSSEKKYYICSKPLVPNCGITGRCKRSSN